MKKESVQVLQGQAQTCRPPQVYIKKDASFAQPRIRLLLYLEKQGHLFFFFFTKTPIFNLFFLLKTPRKDPIDLVMSIHDH